MSLNRLIYYSAIIGGWAAFLGWMVAEITGWAFDVDPGSYVELALFAGLVGAAIGAGLNVVAGMTNPQWKQVAKRVLLGLLGGGAGGVVGGVLGNTLYVAVVWGTTKIGFPDFLVNALGLIFLVLGWTILGIGVGMVDGLFGGAKKKLLNGVLGGAAGGLIGGLLFEPIAQVVATEMSSRATGFVALGLCIGFLIGCVQVVLKEAWLTVRDGFGAGRELILDRDVEIIGRGDHLRLPFRGPANTGLLIEHFQIARRGGSFVLELLGSASGVSVRRSGGEYRPVTGAYQLSNEDVIRFNNNQIEFRERRKSTHAKEICDEADGAPAQPTTTPKPAVPLKPPARKSSDKAAGATTESLSPQRAATTEVQAAKTKPAAAPVPKSPPPPPPPPPPPKR